VRDTGFVRFEDELQALGFPRSCVGAANHEGGVIPPHAGGAPNAVVEDGVDDRPAERALHGEPAGGGELAARRVIAR
jgi:hypothetical protein